MRQTSRSPPHQWTILHAALTRLILSSLKRHCHPLLKAMANSTCMYGILSIRIHSFTILALKMPWNVRGNLSLCLVREALTFKFPHLLHYCAVDTLNSIARERSRIDSAQTLDDRCLTFWNIDRNVMMSLKIGHVAHYFGPLRQQPQHLRIKNIQAFSQLVKPHHMRLFHPIATVPCALGVSIIRGEMKAQP